MGIIIRSKEGQGGVPQLENLVGGLGDNLFVNPQKPGWISRGAHKIPMGVDGKLSREEFVDELELEWERAIDHDVVVHFEYLGKIIHQKIDENVSFEEWLQLSLKKLDWRTYRIEIEAEECLFLDKEEKEKTLSLIEVLKEYIIEELMIRGQNPHTYYKGGQVTQSRLYSFGYNGSGSLIMP